MDRTLLVRHHPDHDASLSCVRWKSRYTSSIALPLKLLLYSPREKHFYQLACVEVICQPRDSERCHAVE